MYALTSTKLCLTMVFSILLDNLKIKIIGDHGDLFYIVIQGKVSVRVPTTIYKDLNEIQLYEILHSK